MTYLLGDHLDSAAVLADTSGQLVDRVRFYPFGGYRGSDSSLQTDRGFTGHRQNDDLGLVYMNARYYVQGIGRFASADTIVPNPQNPQSHNRYSYVLNNPLALTDPTGHEVCEDVDSQGNCIAPDLSDLPDIPDGPIVTFTGSWGSTQEDLDKQVAIQEAAEVMGQAFAEALNKAHPDWHLSAREAFLLVFQGPVEFHHTGETTGYGAFTRSSNLIDIYNKEITYETHWAIHELGHAFDKAVTADRHGAPSARLGSVQAADPSFPNRIDDASSGSTFGFAGNLQHPWQWQHSESGKASEEFADMMVGYSFDSWETRSTTGITTAGQARSGFMTNNMLGWLERAIQR